MPPMPFEYNCWPDREIDGFIILQYPELYTDPNVLIKVLFLVTTLVESL